MPPSAHYPLPHRPIIIPLVFALDNINDSYIRHARKKLTVYIREESELKRLDVAKQNGTFSATLTQELIDLIDGNSDDARSEIKDIEGFGTMKPTESMRVDATTGAHVVMGKFFLPGITPRQALHFK